MPKALLSIDGKSALSLIIENLRACNLHSTVVVVSRGILEKARCFEKNAKIAVNPYPERGMLSSVKIGISTSPEMDGYLIMPVDHPYVKPETYAQLIAQFRKKSDAVIKPVFNSISGHPIIIPKGIFKKIPDGDVPGGLNAIIKSSDAEIIEIPVDDNGILRNINYPQDMHKNEK